MAAPSVPSAQAAMVGKVLDNGSLRLLNIIGCGGFGTVFSALDIQSVKARDAKLYAVKIVASKPRSRARQTQRKELYFHHKVSHHPHIVTLHRTFHDSNFTHIILDMISGGDLFTAIVDRATYLGEEELTRRVFIQLIDAVAFCHSIGVFHRDIKPENIMCSADTRHWYLSDFGLASDSAKSMTFKIGSKLYMAPEIINAEGLYKSYAPRLSDVWAIGLVFVNVLVSCGPWEAAKRSDARYDYYLRHPDHLSQSLPLTKSMNSLIPRILEPTPEARISLSELRVAIKKVDHFYPSSSDLEFTDPGAVKIMNQYISTRVKRLEKCANEAFSPAVPALSSAPERVQTLLRAPPEVLPPIPQVESHLQRPRLIGLGLFKAASQVAMSPHEHKQVKLRAAPPHVALHQHVAGSESSPERAPQASGYAPVIAQDGIPPNAPFPSPPITPLDHVPMPVLSSSFLSAPDSASGFTGPITPHAQSLLSVNIVPGAHSVESRNAREVGLPHAVAASFSSDLLSMKTRRSGTKFIKNVFAKLRLNSPSNCR